jgi:hypothetical protein
MTEPDGKVIHILTAPWQIERLRRAPSEVESGSAK